MIRVHAQVPGEHIRTERLVAAENGMEFALQIRAVAPEASWQEEGRECAPIKILVDGMYDQHLFLFGGGQDVAQEFIVGPFSAGEHIVQLYVDNSWTPALHEKPAILSLTAIPLQRRDPGQEPWLRAPILYLRRDTLGRFSDVPLVLYWDHEFLRPDVPRVVYTVIFSNEDGGTETERLMARWGRTTDIEWCYSYNRTGEILLEEFQGRDHKTLPFRGMKVGWHPVLYDVTTNNNFSDTLDDPPPVRMRPLPVYANLAGKARESMMDRFPWTYAIMAQEMHRESKIENPPDAGTAKLSDLRNYVYFEVCVEQRGTELYFEIQLKGDRRWFRSDHGDPAAGIGRSGCVRSTIEVPGGTRTRNVAALRIRCRPAPLKEGERPVPAPEATIRAVPKLFFLEGNYHPGPSVLGSSTMRKLKPGQSMTIAATGASR